MYKENDVVMIKNKDLDGFKYEEGNAKLIQLIMKDTNKEYWVVEFENEPGHFYRRWLGTFK